MFWKCNTLLFNEIFYFETPKRNDSRKEETPYKNYVILMVMVLIE